MLEKCDIFLKYTPVLIYKIKNVCSEWSLLNSDILSPINYKPTTYFLNNFLFKTLNTC